MKKLRWELHELRNAVRTRPADSSDALKAVNSVARSLQIVDYHVFEAKDAVAEAKAEDETASVNAFYLAMGFADDKEQEKHNSAMLVSQAHTVAGIHATRNALDIFSQLANRLVLTPQLAVEDCDIHKVAAAMGSTRPGAKLTTELGELLNMHWFKYVSAYTNTSKHRRLIDHVFHVSFEENGSIGARIGHFDYLPKYPKHAAWQRYPSYSVREVLSGVLDVRNQVVTCGEALNELMV